VDLIFWRLTTTQPSDEMVSLPIGGDMPQGGFFIGPKGSRARFTPRLARVLVVFYGQAALQRQC
jgi:hypothetical protein